jgi:hypothetical protein
MYAAAERRNGDRVKALKSETRRNGFTLKFDPSMDFVHAQAKFQRICMPPQCGGMEVV